MKRNVGAMLVGAMVGLLAAGCGGLEPAEVDALTQAAESVPVRLLWVKADNAPGEGNPTEVKGYMAGFIEVANLAYHKDLVVHYTAGKTGEWEDVKAEYHGPAGAGREVWRFKTKAYQYSPRLSVDFRFAIRYTVAGKTYWDNNAHHDYRVGVGARPLSPQMVLAGQAVALFKADAYGNEVRGQLALKNYAYHKDVQVVYSTDGWKTMNRTTASYANSSWGCLDYTDAKNQEKWGFTLQLPSGTTSVKFAISCSANGQTTWDNNFKKDYEIQIPGRL